MRSATVLGLCLLAAGCGGAPLLIEGDRDLGVAPLEVKLVRMTSAGLLPSAAIELMKNEGGVVFVNDTPDRVVAVVISGVLCHLGCSFTQDFAADDAATFTARPLDPGAAASRCVHRAGTFSFEVHGLFSDGEPLAGVLHVRDGDAGRVP
jgi:hypothetical protein